MSARPIALALLGTLGALGCGGPPAPKEPPAAVAPTSEPGAGHGVAVEAEIGALDEAKVKKAFERASGELLGCFKKGLERVPYLAGQVRFALRIDQAGRARVAYLKESTLGDRATEDCMLSAAKGASYPKPQGGREGLAETTLDFPATGDERPPVDWTADRLGPKLRAVKGAVASCRAKGAGPLRVTLYVDTDGKPITVGVASADEKGELAAPCVVDKVRALTLPSPGSWPAKVTIEAD